jgi:hypothetical protein
VKYNKKTVWKHFVAQRIENAKSNRQQKLKESPMMLATPVEADRLKLEAPQAHLHHPLRVRDGVAGQMTFLESGAPGRTPAQTLKTQQIGPTST